MLQSLFYSNISKECSYLWGHCLSIYNLLFNSKKHKRSKSLPLQKEGHHPPTSMVQRWSMGPASKFLGIHIPQDLTWKPRLIQPGKESSLGPHFLVFTEEKPPLFRHPGQLLPLLHLEHPYQLYCSLEEELVWHGRDCSRMWWKFASCYWRYL